MHAVGLDSRSEGMTEPPSILERPTAKSHMSMYSCTSPIPSGAILPTSNVSYVTYVGMGMEEKEEGSREGGREGGREGERGR